MRTFPKSIAAGALAAALLIGAAASSNAEPSDQADVNVTINDNGVVTAGISAGTFAPLTYSESAAQTSAGTLSFTVNDPRYAKGDWQVTASVTDFNASFATDIDLVATSSTGGITTPSTTLSSASPVTVIQAGTTNQITDSTAAYDATVNVPAGTTPGSYAATITIAVSNVED
jgi:hypothetical protein